MNNNKITDPCVICGKSMAHNALDPRWLKGNNAEPLARGQCCDICDRDRVIPARIKQITAWREQTT